MILVHNALDFFPFNAKQKLNLTLPNHGLVLEKVYRVIEFNQKPWLKLWIDMNTELRKKAKNLFEKDLFKLINNAIFKKATGNVENDRYAYNKKRSKKELFSVRMKLSCNKTFFQKIYWP